MIRIKDLQFSVASAEILAAYSVGDTEVRWYINIQAEQRRIDEIRWEPRIYADGVTIDAKKWTQLDRVAIEVKDESEEVGWDAGYIYVFEHLPMRRNLVALRGRHGQTFDLSWDAVCDVRAGDDYGKDLELSIRTPVQFSGVEVRGTTDVPLASKELGRLLDVTELMIAAATELPGDGGQSVWFCPKHI